MYSQLAEIPLPTNAYFTDHHDDSDSKLSGVHISYSSRDHLRNAKKSMEKSIFFPKGAGESVAAATLLRETNSDIVAQAVSRLGKLALLKNVKVDGATERMVEIWTKEGGLLVSMKVTEYHGDFYSDELVGSLSFSFSESSLLYTAEGKITKSDDPFEKFRFNPDFGEGFVGKKNPTIFIVNWGDQSSNSRATINQLSSTSGIRFGPAIFSPNSDHILYATVYEYTEGVRFLGIKGCFNRPSGIWQLVLLPSAPSTSLGDESKVTLEQVQVKLRKLTPAHLSCRSPYALEHDGKATLLWLSCATGGAHLATSALHSLDITSDSTVLAIPTDQVPLVPIVEVPDSKDGFPGLYPEYSLARSCTIFSPSGPSILLHSQWGSRTIILQVFVEDGSVKNLTPAVDNNLFSWSLLATDGKSRFICSRSSPSVPYEIMVGNFDAASGGELRWQSIDKPILPENVATALGNIETSIISIPGRPLVETIVIQQKRDAMQPCITVPHGGPHIAAATSFSPQTTSLVLEGCKFQLLSLLVNTHIVLDTVSLPNYTGSTGFGERFLQHLIGRCGTLDIEDCITAARHLITIGISEEGPGMQFITGGSHGGFITAHLIGRYPTFFSSAILRNPVISAGEPSTSDIPDWYFAEFGFDYPISSSSPLELECKPRSITSRPPFLYPETFARLYAMSPISNLESIIVPVLLLLGGVDRRVAPSQGIGFYHELKTKYTHNLSPSDVEMLIFDGESHLLDGVEAAKACFEATKVWFSHSK